MIDITLIYKKKVGSSDDFNIEKIEKGLISIQKPKTYKELEEEIRNKFKLGSKEIAIKAIIDSEDINIKDEDTYTDEDNQNAKRFKVCLEEDISEASTDIDLNIDELLDIKDELIIDENEFKTIIETQKNSQLNQEELKMDEIEEEKGDYNKSLDQFMTDIENKIKTTTENYKTTFMDSIKNDLKPFDEFIKEKIKLIKSDIDNNLKETEKIASTIKGMKAAIKKLASNNIIHKPIIDNDDLEKEKKEEKEVKKDEDKKKEVKNEKPVKPREMTDEEVEKIFSDFDDQYGLVGILDEKKKEELLNKIRELNGNIELLSEYIEDKFI